VAAPRPVVGPTDPEYFENLHHIQDLLAALPGDEVAVFQDEVDVDLNSKISGGIINCPAVGAPERRSDRGVSPRESAHRSIPQQTDEGVSLLRPGNRRAGIAGARELRSARS
jgi:hypothetical protein